MSDPRQRFDSAQRTFLSRMAQRYIWWETPDGSLAYPQRILAQVMNIGTWNDICRLVELFTSQDLQTVLDKAEIGQFNERSWHFWHNRLTGKVPPMPRRVLQ
jgi:hypothetical protein